jgi:hypothetical protein
VVVRVSEKGGNGMNLYELKTKSHRQTYYVAAEHPTDAQEYLKTMLDLADYDFYDNRKTIEIRFVAKLVTENDWNGKLNFEEGNNFLIAGKVRKEATE